MAAAEALVESEATVSWIRIVLEYWHRWTEVL
jgi:hypothetical protein